MKDILHEIVESKRRDLAQTPADPDLRRRALEVTRPALSMSRALAASPTGIIAEFKRRSPSKGWIKADADPAVIPPGYQQSGASALSVLTDTDYFGGALADLERARPLVSIPILRKDFIIDESQIHQARLAGADAVLLIAACLTPARCRELAAEAHAMGLETLLEIHSESELQYVGDDIDMVGVNNRDLGTFHTDVEHSFSLASLLPVGKVLVSESGISDPATVTALRQAGFRGFLIGETFMKTADPAAALSRFVEKINV